VTSAVAAPLTCAIAGIRWDTATPPTPAAAAMVLQQSLRFMVPSSTMCLWDHMVEEMYAALGRET